MKSSKVLLFVFLLGLAGLLGVSVSQLLKRHNLERNKVTGIAVMQRTGDTGKKTAYYVQSYKEAILPKNSETGIPLVEIKKGEDVKKIVNKKSVLFFENNVIFEPETVIEGNFTIASIEFEKPVGFDNIPKDRILTLHTIRDKDLKNYNEEETVKRYVRAVVERKICILYLKEPAYLSKLESALIDRGILLMALEKNPYQMEGIGYIKSVKYKQVLTLLLALSMPLLGFFVAMGQKRVWLRFLIITAFSLTAAIMIAGYLSETVFMLKLEQFMGVKAALLLPPLFVFFLLAFENRGAFTGKVILILSGVLLSFAVIMVIARSGNYSMPLLPYEKELRDWFEKVFYARPRFKEFLAGHPALIFGLYLYGCAKGEANRKLEMVLAVFLTALGMLGQTSLINTFCHAHADISLSVLRTVYGLFLGSLLGGTFILCHKIARK